MTLQRAATTSASDFVSTRDFDYAVGDDVRQLEERIRREIAARIRQMARLEAAGTADRRVYERAAMIAEDLL